MPHSYVWHDSFICVTWLIHMCDMTHSYVWHDSFICVTWTEYMYYITQLYMWCEPCFSWVVLLSEGVLAISLWCHPFILVTWRIDVWDMTQIYIWHVFLQSYCCSQALSRCWLWCDSFMYATRLLQMRDVTWLLHYVKWLKYLCDITHSCMRAFRAFVMSHMYIWDMTQMYTWHDSNMCMTWLMFSRCMCDVTHAYVQDDSFILMHMCKMTHHICI